MSAITEALDRRDQLGADRMAVLERVAAALIRGWEWSELVANGGSELDIEDAEWRAVLVWACALSKVGDAVRGELPQPMHRYISWPTLAAPRPRSTTASVLPAR